MATLNTHNWATIKINIHQINIVRQPQTHIQKIDVIYIKIWIYSKKYKPKYKNV